MRTLLSKIRNSDPFILVVVVCSLVAVLPLAGPNYFFDAHDAPHSVFFLTEFDAALRDGVWYPGWGTDHALGYGYPTFVLYSPLAYYGAEVFLLLGAGKVAAVKWIWALATVGAGLAMYAYARRVLGRLPGLLAAVVYVYTPYHLADIYVRAALAEYCAFVWMPLTLLAFHNLAEKATARRLALAGLAYGALWLTHNVTAIVFTPLLAAYVLFRLLAEHARIAHGLGKLVGRAMAALGGAAWGMGIAAALLLPNLLERRYISQEQWVAEGYSYAQHFVYPFQLLSGFWGYDPALPGPADGMSFQLGTVPVILGLAATIFAFRRGRPTKDRALILFLAGATLLVVAFMLPLSAPAWALLPIASLIQFPWRLLALTTVTMAVLAGAAVAHAQGARLKPELSGGYRALLILVVVLASFPYTLPEYTPAPDIAEGPLLALKFDREYPDMVGMTAWAQEQPSDSPLVEQYLAGGPLVTAEALAAGAEVEMIRASGASDELWVRSERGTALRFYTYYFPGWRVYIDGERLPDAKLRPETAYGLLTVDVPAGEHHVLLRWGDTPVRVAGKALTVICLLLALALIAISSRWPISRLTAGRRPLA
ncbi:MAG: glycosyltransferase family 39 protein [Anaerolineae bacterium]|nr:glycosyltransferase family 39 protein [Anaerolineae bacterium]